MDGTTINRALLRQFGLVLGGFIALVFGLSSALFADEPWRWPWVASSVLITTAFTVPMLLKPVFIVWSFIGKWLGYINSRIIITVLFFGIILPMGLARRIFGKDPMQRRWDKNADSYLEMDTDSHTRDMRRPF